MLDIGALVRSGTTVTATLVDEDGTTVTGQTFPLTLSYVAASNGNYRGVLEDDLNLTESASYWVQVTADTKPRVKRGVNFMYCVNSLRNHRTSGAWVMARGTRNPPCSSA